MESKPTAVTFRGNRRVVFRSRLEAHWAKAFDLLSHEWEYEPQRIDIGDGITYTPDFRVKGIGWIEIKPTLDALGDSVARIQRFISRNPTERVYVLYGNNPYRSQMVILARSPLEAIATDEMVRLLVLGGEQRREIAKWDYPAFSSQIRGALEESTNVETDPLLVREIMELSDTRQASKIPREQILIRRIMQQIVLAHKTEVA